MAQPARENRRPSGVPNSEHTQFKPGQSGNPGGRPKGVAAKARELVNDDPSAVLEMFLEIAGNPAEKSADRIAAGREYLDRGWGKAPAFTPIDGEDPLDLESLDRVRELVDELASRRAGGPAPDAAVVPPARADAPASVAASRSG